jgi:hypothetical protein
MMTPLLKAALGGAALWSVMLIAVTERDPPRPFASVPDPITERWLPEPELLRKSDRLPLPPVETIGPATVEPAAEPPSSPALIPEPKPRPRTISHHASLDVCTRHGMRKVTTHGGRSWRCRRSA